MQDSFARKTPVYFRSADASGAVRTAVSDHALRRRDRRREAILRANSFGNRNRNRNYLFRKRINETADRRRFANGDEPRLHAFSKHHAGAKAGSRTTENEDEKANLPTRTKIRGESVTENQVKREQKPEKMQDIKDLFNAWNNLDDEGEPDDLQGAEAWSHNEMPEQPLERATWLLHTTNGIVN